jgi:hypothetical protein
MCFFTLLTTCPPLQISVSHLLLPPLRRLRLHSSPELQLSTQEVRVVEDNKVAVEGEADAATETAADVLARL